MKYTMPMIDLEAAGLDGTELSLAKEILKPDGRLFASKPNKASGDVQYLWRMVAFGISPNPKHQCLPIMAEFDLDIAMGGYDYYEVRKRTTVLDNLALRIERSLPLEDRHGTMTWARVLGAF